MSSETTPDEVVETSTSLAQNKRAELLYQAQLSVSEHVGRNVMLFVHSLPYLKEDPRHEALRCFLEVICSEIWGLKTGWVRREFSGRPVNPTQAIELTYREREGRTFENLLGEWMASEGEDAQILFIEPDATYTRAVAVWHFTGSVQATGNVDQFRSLQVEHPKPTAQVCKLVGDTTYNDPDSMALAQTYVDKCAAVSAPTSFEMRVDARAAAASTPATDSLTPEASE